MKRKIIKLNLIQQLLAKKIILWYKEIIINLDKRKQIL